MGFANKLKENIKKEINAFKYNRDLENDPDTVRNRLDMEKKQIKIQKEQLLTKQSLEQDKRELQTLKNSTGIRGQIKSGLTGLRSQLDNVKSRNNSAEQFKLRNPKQERSQSVFDIKGSGSQITANNPRGSSGLNQVGGSYRPFGSGVMDNSRTTTTTTKKKLRSKTIIIKL
jgi:hypothetical protein